MSTVRGFKTNPAGTWKVVDCNHESHGPPGQSQDTAARTAPQVSDGPRSANMQKAISKDLDKQLEALQGTRDKLQPMIAADQAGGACVGEWQSVGGRSPLRDREGERGDQEV